MEDDVVVGRLFVARVMEFADRVLCAVSRDAEGARHAEMHDEHVAGRKIGKEVFRAAAKASDGLILEPRREVLREGKAQVGAARLDFPEARALHDGREPPANRFNLGEFRHSLSRKLDLARS